MPKILHFNPELVRLVSKWQEFKILARQQEVVEGSKKALKKYSIQIKGFQETHLLELDMLKYIFRKAEGNRPDLNN